MLFNSYIFIFAFLPAILLIYWGLHGAGKTHAALTFLVPASLLFYAYWNPPFLLLLLGSIAFNYIAGLDISRNKRRARPMVFFAVIVNIAALAWFKYALLIAGAINVFAKTNLNPGDIFLPLGISFFTFHQITYLIDIYKGNIAPAGFRNYALYVGFFPQLIAGPIVRAWEIVPQFENFTGDKKFWRNFACGSALFAMGLFKKAVIADNLAFYASPIFAIAEKGGNLSFFDGWSGALAYTFQLYFDFSGYSDMALGLALMLGFVLPINFLSPYKSTSVSDFWRRWHITMSRFFRDYLYIPLGGSQRSCSRTIFNLMVTMLLAGLWHGAGWTFAAWGLLHGLFLVINHSFTCFREKYLPRLKIATWPYKIFAHLLTMFAIVIGWVLFHAENFTAAMNMFAAMFGNVGIVVPARMFQSLGWLENSGFLRLPGAGERWIATDLGAPFWIAAAYILCLTLPASVEYFRFAESDSKLKFTLNFKTSLMFAAMTVIALFSMQRISEFLYFQF